MKKNRFEISNKGLYLAPGIRSMKIQERGPICASLTGSKGEQFEEVKDDNNDYNMFGL